MQTNSASGTGNLASKYSFPPLPRCFEEFRPSCDAERISCLCLQNGAVSYEDFESLISVLPPDHELGSAGSESKTFTTGAYVYSCTAGLRSNVCKFPATTKLLASILSCLFSCTPLHLRWFVSAVACTTTCRHKQSARLPQLAGARFRLREWGCVGRGARRS